MQNSKCSYRGSFPIGLALQLVLLCKNGIEMVLDHLNCYISEVCSIMQNIDLSLPFRYNIIVIYIRRTAIWEDAIWI